MKQEKIYLFSLAISPDTDVIDSVKKLKNLLREQANRDYISANSLAHITLFSFKANMDGYISILEEFKRILSGLAPFDLKLSGFSSFPPNPLQTFYIRPEESSSQKIIKYCGTINFKFRRSLKRIRLKEWTNRARKDVHMSIGHELSETEIEKCNAITREGFNKSFLCDSFVIRKFNQGKGQYDIIDTIPLLGYQHIAGEQLNLF